VLKPVVSLKVEPVTPVAVEPLPVVALIVAPFVVVPSAITKGPAAFAARGAENVVLALIVIGAARLLMVSRVVIMVFLRD
jgi:hypothetical protein